jgi:hypothetical protein
MYPSQKKGHMSLTRRGNISVKGDPIEKISQVTILLIKKSIVISNKKQLKKIIGICMKYT